MKLAIGNWQLGEILWLTMIKIKRAYESAAKQDGERYLVDRLWPRGITKADLRVEAWLKPVSPSPELCKWFSHDPAKWPEFRRRYFGELKAHPETWEALRDAASQGTVTLVFGARDTEHNNAVVLKEFLESRLGKSST